MTQKESTARAQTLHRCGSSRVDLFDKWEMNWARKEDSPVESPTTPKHCTSLYRLYRAFCRNATVPPAFLSLHSAFLPPFIQSSLSHLLQREIKYETSQSTKGLVSTASSTHSVDSDCSAFYYPRTLSSISMESTYELRRTLCKIRDGN